MAITTKPLYLPHGITQSQSLAAFLRSVIDRIEKPRVEAVPDLDQTITGTIGEIQDISDKVDEILTKLREANILDE